MSLEEIGLGFVGVAGPFDDISKSGKLKSSRVTLSSGEHLVNLNDHCPRTVNLLNIMNSGIRDSFNLHFWQKTNSAAGFQ